MSLFVVATVPVSVGEVFEGRVEHEGEALFVGGVRVPACQGTAAMLGAADAVCKHLGLPAPYALLGGDIGRGEGTRAVYEHLLAAVERVRPTVVAFHYLQPIMALMKRAVSELATMPQIALVADAGGMYAAKGSGNAGAFALMTPDVGEVGFLADEAATHPAYVSQYLFGRDDFDPVELGRLSYEAGGPEVLLIKGSTDYIVRQGAVVATVTEPLVPNLEAIGGTGDTVTGLATALMAGGLSTAEASLFAARANRMAGLAMRARPDHHARDLVAQLPAVLEQHLAAWRAEGLPT